MNPEIRCTLNFVAIEVKLSTICFTNHIFVHSCFSLNLLVICVSILTQHDSKQQPTRSPCTEPLSMTINQQTNSHMTNPLASLFSLFGKLSVDIQGTDPMVLAFLGVSFWADVQPFSRSHHWRHSSPETLDILLGGKVITLEPDPHSLLPVTFSWQHKNY